MRILPLFLPLLILACGHPKAEPTQATIAVTTTRTKNAPSWIDNADRGRRLTAVGIAQPNSISSKELQREIAVNRALVHLGEKLQIQIQSLYEENQTQAAGNGGKAGASEDISRTIHNVVSVKIKGATIPYFWTDTDGTLYCLAQLSEETSKDAFQEVSRQSRLQEAVKE